MICKCRGSVFILANTLPIARMVIADMGGADRMLPASPRSIRSLDGCRAHGFIDVTTGALPDGYQHLRRAAVMVLERSVVKCHRDR